MTHKVHPSIADRPLSSDRISDTITAKLILTTDIGTLLSLQGGNGATASHATDPGFSMAYMVNGAVLITQEAVGTEEPFVLTQRVGEFSCTRDKGWVPDANVSYECQGDTEWLCLCAHIDAAPISTNTRRHAGPASISAPADSLLVFLDAVTSLKNGSFIITTDTPMIVEMSAGTAWLIPGVVFGNG